MDAKQYVEELLKAAGVTDESQKQVVLGVFSNEAAAKKLSDDVLRQQDYSRNMDTLKADKDKWSKFYQDTLTWKAGEEQRLADLDARVKAYEAAYPDGGGERPVIQPVQGDFISKKDFEAEQAKRDGMTIGLIKTMGRLASQHVIEFKEPLDVDGLEKIAVERNIPLIQAYDEMTKPRRTELQQAQWEAKLKEAREAGARDFASTHKIPIDTTPREYHTLFDRDPAKQVEYKDGRLTPAGERSLRDNFVESWNTTRPGGTSE